MMKHNKKMQAAKGIPTDSEISLWLDNLPLSTGEDLLPEYTSDKIRGWTPDSTSLPQGPAPFAVSKNQADFFELILFGKDSSYRRISSSSRVENKSYIEPSSKKSFDCTTIRYDHSQRNLLEILIKHLIYANRDDSNISPNTVCTIVLPWIETGSLDIGDLLSDNEQLGLFGELYLLRRLLVLATKHKIPHIEVLNRWSGPDAEKRDFANTDQSTDAMTIAIEAKATSDGTREHRISSVSQLNYTNLELYVFSINARMGTTGTENLLDIAVDIHNNRLDHDCRPLYLEKLGSYGSGFSFDHQRSYSRIKKYELHDDYPPALIKITDNTHAMTEDSFKVAHWGNKNWSSVQYTLNLAGLKDDTMFVNKDLSKDLDSDVEEVLLNMIRP